MATIVNVTVGSGSGTVFECEVSGGEQVEMKKGESRNFTIGLVDYTVQMLTLIRKSTGTAVVQSVDGKILASVDGGKDKKLKKGGSVKLVDRNKRALIREAG